MGVETGFVGGGLELPEELAVLSLHAGRGLIRQLVAELDRLPGGEVALVERAASAERDRQVALLFSAVEVTVSGYRWGRSRRWDPLRIYLTNQA
jgi:hypothetical protein